MITPRNIKVRIAFIAGAIVSLFLFNLTILPQRKATQQAAFENWLGEIDPKLENPELTGTPLPPLSVKFDAPARSIHLALSIGPSSDQTASTRFARILQMARESNLFSLPPKENAEVRLLVESEREKFSASFNVSDIEQNSPAQAMLKLLEIYSHQEPSVAHEESK